MCQYPSPLFPCILHCEHLQVSQTQYFSLDYLSAFDETFLVVPHLLLWLAEWSSLKAANGALKVHNSKPELVWTSLPTPNGFIAQVYSDAPSPLAYENMPEIALPQLLQVSPLFIFLFLKQRSVYPLSSNHEAQRGPTWHWRLCQGKDDLPTRKAFVLIWESYGH